MRYDTVVRALIYCRISDDKTSEEAGVGRQEADCRGFCARQGFEVVEPPLVDNDISASQYSRKRRPAYRRLLELVESGEAEVIVAWHIDRLYRQPKELEHLVDVADRTGVVIHTLNGKLDLTDSDGKAMARVLVAMAAKASDDTSRRVRRMHQQLAEEGRPAGAVPPYGYRAVPIDPDAPAGRKEWIIDPEAAARIRDAATRVIAGGSLRAICTEWNAQGIPAARGGRWNTTPLRRLLLNPRIAGLRTWNGEVVREATWPAILTPEESVDIRAVLRTRPGVATAHKYVLGSGLAVCGNCGHPLQSRPNSRGKRAYACINGTNYGGCGKVHRVAEPIEQAVQVRALVALNSTEPPAEDPEAKRLEAGVQAASARLSQAAAAYAAGDLDLAAYKSARAAVEARTAKLQAELAQRMQATALPAGGFQLEIRSAQTGETLFEGFRSDGPWTAWWKQAAFDEQKALLRRVIERVEVAPAGRGHRADLAGFWHVPGMVITWNEPWASWWASDEGQRAEQLLASLATGRGRRRER